MPPYEKQLIEETAKLTQENNKILKGMNRAMWWGRVFGFLKWVVIIAITVGAYYYIQPYIESLLSVYSGLGDILPSIETVGEGLKNLPI